MKPEFRQVKSQSPLPQHLQPLTRWLSRMFKGLAKVVLYFAFVLSALWMLLVFWIHLNDYTLLRGEVCLVALLLSVWVLVAMLRRLPHWQKWLAGYVLLWLALLVWFLALPAKQDRPWKAEVRHSVSFSQDETNPNLITLHNVRDFDWTRPKNLAALTQPDQPYFHAVDGDDNEELVATERWTERSVDLSKLTGVDIINSYWMGEPIGHTLLSFRFADARPLSFSFEIRKEEDESFSTFGGFVRQFELALIAAEERDIVYTRSNVRGEQVYIFPIAGLSQAQIQQLFMNYLQVAAQLQQEAQWYNTVTYNCTTIIYDLAKKVSGGKLPWDYRILASGYIPEYLYDRGFLSAKGSEQALGLNDVEGDSLMATGQKRHWTIDDWYQKAHINPKVASFGFADNHNSYRYSQLIRQGLPQPQPIRQTAD